MSKITVINYNPKLEDSVIFIMDFLKKLNITKDSDDDKGYFTEAFEIVSFTERMRDLKSEEY